MVAVPNVVFYDDTDAGLPLVRFAFCKRLEVLDEAVAAPEGAGAMRVAADPARHRVGGPRRQLRAPRADDRAMPRRNGARLVVLTEMFSTGFSMDTERIAEPVDGPSAQFLVEQARAHGVWVCGSVPERAAGRHDRPSNLLVLAAPDGTMHRYAKIHPFTLRRRARALRRGRRSSSPSTSKACGCSFFVCYDLRFADEFWAARARHRLLRRRRPTGREPRRDHWRTLLQARAIENQAYVVGVNRVGSGGGLDYAGTVRSCCRSAARWRRPAGEHEEILLHDVTAAEVAETRAKYPFLNDRR